jgi:iron complex transport system substrate-binding protein
MQQRIVVLILCLGFLISCTSGPGNKRPAGSSSGLGKSSDATGFAIANFGKYKKLTVTDPWQKSSNNQFDYYLAKKGDEIPEEIKGKQVFLTPLKNVVCLSTTHIGYLDALGELSAVSGLSGSAYLTNPFVRKGIEENRIHEVGYDRGLNYEMIMKLKPDAVFAFGVGSEINAQLNKLHDLGIPVVLVGEYLEQTPLAKADWIKFFGAFFEKEELADTIFNRLNTSYNTIKASVSGMTEKPKVLTGLPFKDTWWIAGGKSNLAVLIEDAGGKFLWNENSSQEAFPVSLEEVFLRASGADFWINCGSVTNMDELMAFDARFSQLPAVKKSQVYNNNLRTSPGGGTDYWESGVVHPDLILRDLVNIFHPQLNVVRDFNYYKKIN